MHRPLHQLTYHQSIYLSIPNEQVDFEGVSKFMRFSGPEHNGKLIRSTALSNTPEATVVMSKVVESFILDTGLKAWLAKEIEPETDVSRPTELQTVDLLRAIKTHDALDFLSDVAMPTGKKTNAAKSSSSSQKKKKQKR